MGLTLKPRLALPGLALIAADQALKRWADREIPVLSRKPILGQSWLVFSRVLNRGIAGDEFSWVPRGYIEKYTRYFPTAILALVALFSIHRFRAKASAIERWGLTLILAGGISNLTEHWVSEFVTDPLQIYSGSGEYIPFNLADVGIGAGIVLVFWGLATSARKRD